MLVTIKLHLEMSSVLFLDFYTIYCLCSVRLKLFIIMQLIEGHFFSNIFEKTNVIMRTLRFTSFTKTLEIQLHYDFRTF